MIRIWLGVSLKAYVFGLWGVYYSGLTDKGYLSVYFNILLDYGGSKRDLPVYVHQEKYQYFIRKYINLSDHFFIPCKEFIILVFGLTSIAPRESDRFHFEGLKY